MRRGKRESNEYPADLHWSGFSGGGIVCLAIRSQAVGDGLGCECGGGALVCPRTPAAASGAGFRHLCRSPTPVWSKTKS